MRNEIGVFVKLAAGGQFNFKLPAQAPTFEERVGEEERVEGAERCRDEEQKVIETVLKGLDADTRRRLILDARGRYEISLQETDEDVLERVMYKLLIRFDEGEDWRNLLRELCADSGLSDDCSLQNVALPTMQQGQLHEYESAADFYPQRCG